jgi:DNA-binding NarL/FixJ family response regulator
MTEAPLRVLIADDHPVFRQGLRAIIEGAGDMVLVGEAATGLEAVAGAEELGPDVVLMDLQMPELGGIEATRRIVARRPDARILVLTMIEQGDSIFAAMRAGARGYLLKGSDRAEVLQAVRAVGAGNAIFAPAVADRLSTLLGSGDPVERAFPDLPDRERDVLERMAQGRSNAEIAADLALSLKTVRNHVSNVFTKLQVTGRAQAIVKAREAGLSAPSLAPPSRG